jgi:hypothetical protein
MKMNAKKMNRQMDEDLFCGESFLTPQGRVLGTSYLKNPGLLLW